MLAVPKKKPEATAPPRGRPPIAGKPRLERVTLRLHADEVAALKAHAEREGLPFTRFAVTVLENAGVLASPRRQRGRR